MKGRPYELSPANRVVTLILGATFLIMGLGLLISTVKNNLYGYWRTRAEVTVEARLTSVESRHHTGGKTGSWTSTEVSYDYQVGGERFTAGRVSLFKSTGSYYRRLREALDTRTPIRVFIDPVDPRFAVIDREFAWFPFVVAVPFSLTFVGCGLFLGWCLWMNFQGKTIPLETNPAPLKARPRFSPTMSRRHLLLTPLFAALLIGSLASCSRQSREDRVINVETNDAEMEAAIATAREKLPHFWQVFAHPEKGESDFSLKVRLKDSNGTEHFWVNQIERQADGKIFGVINNDPEIVKSVKLNDRVAVPEENISDWLYTREGKMVGNYTLRVLFKQIPPKEVEQYKQMMAEP